MYDARAISNYFLKRAAAGGGSLTVMTLLKILYFAHAWHLAKHGEPLVAQPFEAWQHGPVNRVVYDQVKAFKKDPINGLLKSFDAKACAFVEATSSYDEETTTFLDAMFDYYSQFHAFKLSELTHREGSPWDQVWKAAEVRAVPGMIIPDELIKEWFRGTGGRLGNMQHT